MKPLTLAMLTVMFCAPALKSSAQETNIKVPDFNDKYSNYIRQLESGQTDIDYADFRNSFLESKQYGNKSRNYDDLQRNVFSAVKDKNYKEVIKLTKEMLSIDYTSLFAHKYLQQTYNITGDTANRKKYHDIEFGLILSITQSGDGKTCETGWHVVQIEEEYFILNVLGVQMQRQSTAEGGKNACDKMEGKTEKGEVVTYFFEANKVFEMESKMFNIK